MRLPLVREDVPHRSCLGTKVDAASSFQAIRHGSGSEFGTGLQCVLGTWSTLQEKMQLTLVNLGPSILGGALTTAAGTAFLLPCRILLFVKLGTMLAARQGYATRDQTATLSCMGLIASQRVAEIPQGCEHCSAAALVGGHQHALPP